MSKYREFLEQCREKIDAREILEAYGAENIIESGDELIHSCILDTVIPHHTNGDAAPSASLNKRSLLFNCFSYGGGDIIWLIKQLECAPEDTYHATQVLSRFLHGVRDMSLEDLKARIESYFSDEEDSADTIPRYNAKVLDGWSMIHPHLIEDRHLNEKVLIRKRIGYDMEENKIVIPVFWQGRLVGWQKRKMDHPRWPQLPGVEFEPKYKNSPSFPRFQTLYNYPDHRKVNEVVVVESSVSVLALESFRECLGSESLPHPVGTFGSSPSEKHAEYLRVFDQVTIFYDWDYAGWKGALRLLAMLIDYTSVRVVMQRPDNRDPAEMTFSQASSAIRAAKPAVLVISELEDEVRSWKMKQQQKVRR
jgi:DNA primase